ncbi:XdhC family protein [Paracandidimonas soli]|uniref:Xanthine dehydrogenase accessory factor n=1 Tax=Paracandidimonas soli TaxID=1917182 RepID=A0A4V6P2U7_9BURK|nr:XdhC family protein [Paracandidimonas soli]TCV02570.1 xanthine dehydrogenase accessory factor [Paracandidimonas soli]
MVPADLNVLKCCQSWVDDGYAVVLVTVLRTWGSSPRPPGSMMALREDGAVSGSVSGGCIEDDLIHEMREEGVRALCADALPALRKYGVRAEDAHRFGLPCGGTMELVLEPICGNSVLPELVEQLEQRKAVLRCLDMETGIATLGPAQSGDLPVLVEGRSFRHALGPRYRLIVIGAGELSRYFCMVASGLNFDILVCDPRKDYLVDWDLPDIPVTREMPDDVVLQANPDSRTAVVTLTHDPKLDDLALMHALQSDAFYVGALGSRSNNTRRVERLRDYFDLPQEALSRLHGPAGLYIGSKTPPEIALSILAEMIAAKNGVLLSSQPSVSEGKALLVS